MAKEVASINPLRTEPATMNSTLFSPSSTEGNSLAGNVESVNLLLPLLIVALPSLLEKSTIAPSGRDRQISTNLRAETVTSPSSPVASMSVTPTISTSRSVPVIDSLDCSRLNNTLDNIGNVWRLSTTPTTNCKGFKSASRDKLNFIIIHYLQLYSQKPATNKFKWTGPDTDSLDLSALRGPYPLAPLPSGKHGAP